jgi:hypothetical protein
MGPKGGKGKRETESVVDPASLFPFYVSSLVLYRLPAQVPFLIPHG